MLNAFYCDQNKPTYKICHLLSCINIQTTLEATHYSHFICETAIDPALADTIQAEFPSLKTFYLGNNEAHTINKPNLREADLQGEQVQAALDAISIPIYYRNKEKVFLACNICFAQSVGLLPEQIIGRTFPELFPENIFDVMKEVKRENTKSREVIDYEGVMRDISGVQREVLLRLESLSERGMYIGMIFDIQDRNNAQRLLEKEQVRLRATADISSELIFFKDLNSRFLGCNKAFEKFAGISEKQLIGKTDEDLFELEQAQLCKKQDQKVMTENKIYLQEEYLNDHRGNQHFVKMKKLPLLGKNGVVQGLIGVAKDISAKHLLQKQLAVANVVFENSKDSILVTDGAGKVISANDSASRIFGFIKNELLSEDLSFLYSDTHGLEFYRHIETLLQDDKYWQGDIRYSTKSGDVYYAWLEVHVIEDVDEGTVENIYSYTDLSQFHSREEKIQFLLKHDLLTGLSNRTALFSHLKDTIHRATHQQSDFAVIFMDIDALQMMNDQYGHNAGDRLLKEVAQRLQACVSEEDMLARFVSDEFVIVIDELATEQAAALVSQKITEQLAKPFQIEGIAVSLSASLGISLFPDDGFDADSLLLNATKAMIRGKGDKTTTSHFFTNELTHHSNQQFELEAELKQALALDQFELYYQPQYDFNKKLVIAMESCLRWNHPAQGVVLPIRFLSLLEEIDLVVPLGLKIIYKAAVQAVNWHKKGINFGRITIKIDKMQLLQASFLADILIVLQQTGCLSEWLEFEIEETIFSINSPIIQDNLANISKLGIAITIDCFGLDRALLYSIEKLSIEKFKISGSYIRDIPGYLAGEAMIKSVLVFASSLGIDVVSDNIENIEQAALLNDQYSKSGQNSVQVKAMRSAEAAFFLNSHKRKQNR